MRLQESKNDYFTKKAKEDGFPARSVYKLKEINEKFHLFKKGGGVLDLGCAPGSWLLYVSGLVGNQGGVVGVDIVDLKIVLPSNCKFIKADIADFDFFGRLGRCFDAVVSDTAPHLSGIKEVDVHNAFALSESALKTASVVLKVGGNFVCKILENDKTPQLVKQAKEYFNLVKLYKPKPSNRSKEMYLVCLGFRG